MAKIIQRIQVVRFAAIYIGRVIVSVGDLRTAGGLRFSSRRLLLSRRLDRRGKFFPAAVCVKEGLRLTCHRPWYIIRPRRKRSLGSRDRRPQLNERIHAHDRLNDIAQRGW